MWCDWLNRYVLIFEVYAMSEPHKHKDFIIAWANGAAIQFKRPESEDWIDVGSRNLPQWLLELEYRIKPEPKPDIVRQMYIYSMKESLTTCWTTPNCNKSANVNVIFDGETGALKDVEIIK